MSYNGSGVYSLVSGNPVVTGTTIQSTWANNTLSDLASALSQVLVRDGQAAMTGTLNMGTQNLSNATNLTGSGTLSIGNIVLTGTSVPTAGFYLPSANTVALATSSTLRLSINATGNLVIAAPSTGATIAATSLSQGTVGTFTDGTVTAQLGFSSIAAQFGASSNHGFNLFTNNTSRVLVGNDGRVTINAVVAGTPLTINNASGITGLINLGTAANSFGSGINFLGSSSVKNWQVSGGIYTGGNFEVTPSTANGGGTFSTPVLTITGSTQQVAHYEPLNSINALKNSATYETGSFTGTLTGCTTSPTATFNYSRSGNIVTLNCVGLTATSNTTSCTVTGLPATLTPARSQEQPVRVIDNGTGQMGLMSVSGTTLTFTATVAGGSFTSSGTKGVTSNFSYSYALT